VNQTSLSTFQIKRDIPVQASETMTTMSDKRRALEQRILAETKRQAVCDSSKQVLSKVAMRATRIFGQVFRAKDAHPYLFDAF